MSFKAIKQRMSDNERFRKKLDSIVLSGAAMSISYTEMAVELETMAMKLYAQAHNDRDMDVLYQGLDDPLKLKIAKLP